MAKEKKHRLVIVGWLGNQTAFLDVTRAEAIAKFKTLPGNSKELEEDFLASVWIVEFDEYFGISDVWGREDDF